MTTSDFGLKPVDQSARLAAIKPRGDNAITVDIKESDKAAEAAGFSSREASAPGVDPSVAFATPRRKKKAPEVMTPLSMRVRRSVHVRFLDFAEENNLTNPAALEELLDIAMQVKASEPKQ